MLSLPYTRESLPLKSVRSFRHAPQEALANHREIPYWLVPVVARRSGGYSLPFALSEPLCFYPTQPRLSNSVYLPTHATKSKGRTILTAIEKLNDGDEFPISLPLFKSIDRLEFNPSVTILVGENGTGKSTLLEIIALGLRLPGLTQAEPTRHPLMAAASKALPNFRLVRRVGESKSRSRSKQSGFFFRADDVTGFLQSTQANAEFHRDLAEEFRKSIAPGYGQRLAVGAALSSAIALEDRYGKDPFAKSHGELFLHLLQSRMHSPGIYLLDEPETPLSIGNQIALLQFFIERVNQGAQLILATHAPILMAIPNALILDLNQLPPKAVEWEEIEHVALTKAFLNHPESFLQHLNPDQQ